MATRQRPSSMVLQSVQRPRSAPRPSGHVERSSGTLSSLTKFLGVLATLVGAVATLLKLTGAPTTTMLPPPTSQLRPPPGDLASPALSVVVATLHELREEIPAAENQGVALSLQTLEARGPDPDKLNDLNQNIERIRDEERRDFQERCRPLPRVHPDDGGDHEEAPTAETRLTFRTSREYNGQGLVSLLFSIVKGCPRQKEKGVHSLRFLTYDIQEGHMLTPEEVVPGKQDALDKLFKDHCARRPDIVGCRALSNGLLLTANGLRLYYAGDDDTKPGLQKNYFLLSQRELRHLLQPSLEARLFGGYPPRAPHGDE